MNHLSLPKKLHTPLRIASLWACAASLVTGCSWLPMPNFSSAPPPPSSEPAPSAANPVTPAAQNSSQARHIEDYRAEVAKHVYARSTGRIYQGKLPPLLYAVGVLETDIDARGNVTRVRWMRAPSHAPEVMTEIERTVRSVAPYPAPSKLGKVTIVETWLWHKSGKFQLHTLSEGQL
jgi:periplasmic protein TonB